jgi:hypothetical protein
VPSPARIDPWRYLPDARGGLSKDTLLVAWDPRTTRAEAERVLSAHGATIEQVLDDRGNTRVRFAEPLQYYGEQDPRGMRGVPSIEGVDFDRRYSGGHFFELHSSGRGAVDLDGSAESFLLLTPSAPIEGEFVSVTVLQQVNERCVFVADVLPRRAGQASTDILLRRVHGLGRCSFDDDAVAWDLPYDPVARRRSALDGRRVLLGPLREGMYTLRIGGYTQAFSVAAATTDPDPFPPEQAIRYELAYRMLQRCMDLSGPEVRGYADYQRDAPRTLRRLARAYPGLTEHDYVLLLRGVSDVLLEPRANDFAFRVFRRGCMDDEPVCAAVADLWRLARLARTRRVALHLLAAAARCATLSLAALAACAKHQSSTAPTRPCLASMIVPPPRQDTQTEPQISRSEITSVRQPLRS